MGEQESWWTRKGLYKMIFLIHFTLGVIYCAHVPIIIGVILQCIMLFFQYI